ncbi:MAG: hypothetical protein MJ250_06305 [Alphaproteobacteria bacterium]|nr:hypothetical protein [Alphaproteobacteria bacterium]
MKKKLLSLIIFLSSINLFGCCTMNNLDSEQMIFIDSNISAKLYINDVYRGSTPFKGRITRSTKTKVELKSFGYQTQQIELKYIMNREISEKFNLKDFFLGFLYNCVTLFIPSMIGLYQYMDDRWVDYFPNSYYAEMKPSEEL